MIGKILGGAHRLDDWLRGTLGRPYHAALGIGLVLEIVGRIRELYDAPAADRGIVPLALLMLLSVLLLVHQIGELSEHAQRRRRREAID
jgi:hypothetical protein